MTNGEAKVIRIVKHVLIYTFLIALAVISIVPFYLVIVNCTYSSFDIATKLNLTIGNHLVENYKNMQLRINIWKGFLNSICITVPYTILSGYFGALTAYGFAKYQFKFRNILFGVVLASMMLPAQLSIIGFYQLNLKLNLLNTYWPFIIPGIANATTVFFLRGIISQSIPDSLIEASRIEGCRELTIFNKIVLPCIMPGVVTMCIFNFVSSWNNYMGPLIIMTSKEKYTMPVLITMVKGLYQTDYGAMYLAIALSIVPIILVYCFLSKYIVSGVTAGAVK